MGPSHWEHRCIKSCGKDGGGNGIMGIMVGHGHLEFSRPGRRAHVIFQIDLFSRDLKSVCSVKLF